eukprot:501464-Rhodomonas_salina.1
MGWVVSVEAAVRGIPQGVQDHLRHARGGISADSAAAARETVEACAACCFEMSETRYVLWADCTDLLTAPRSKDCCVVLSLVSCSVQTSRAKGQASLALFCSAERGCWGQVSLEERGESFYNPLLADVCEDLSKAKLLEESEGAQVVFLENPTNKDK